MFDEKDNTNENLDALRQKRDQLQADFDRLKLMTPEQSIDHDASSANGRNTNGTNNNGAVSATTQLALDLDNTQADYRQALAQIADINAQLDVFSGT